MSELSSHHIPYRSLETALCMCSRMTLSNYATYILLEQVISRMRLLSLIDNKALMKSNRLRVMIFFPPYKNVFLVFLEYFWKLDGKPSGQLSWKEASHSGFSIILYLIVLQSEY